MYVLVCTQYKIFENRGREVHRFLLAAFTIRFLLRIQGDACRLSVFPEQRVVVVAHDFICVVCWLVWVRRRMRASANKVGRLPYTGMYRYHTGMYSSTAAVVTQTEGIGVVAISTSIRSQRVCEAREIGGKRVSYTATAACCQEEAITLRRYSLCVLPALCWPRTFGFLTQKITRHKTQNPYLHSSANTRQRHYNYCYRRRKDKTPFSILGRLPTLVACASLWPSRDPERSISANTKFNFNLPCTPPVRC